MSYTEEGCYIATMDSLLSLKFGGNYRERIKQEGFISRAWESGKFINP